MTTMKIATAQVWVHDQDEALAFYTGKLGWNVQTDVTVPELGNFRWLAVSPPDQDDIAVVLMAIPGEPVMDDASREQLTALMSKGFLGGVFLTTDDCQATYEELSARGVEFVDPPTQQPYGIDAGFRDPSGNHFRITQLADLSQYATADAAATTNA
jgi:predicted enzyme related to lactoylglutathione lyase